MNKVEMMRVKDKKKGSLVPRLRFPEFIGKGEWDHAQMGDVYVFKKNNSFSRDMLNYNAGDVKNIHYGDIHTKFSSHFYAEDENVPFVNSNINLECISEDYFCSSGDIIFADASEDMKDIGKCIEIIATNEECILSGLHTIFARQRSSTFIVGFGGYLFQSPMVRALIQKEAQGTKILGISSGRLAKISICFPFAKGEQQKIADCLSSLDERITAESNKLDALKVHKQGLLKQLFPAEGETLPQLRFPEFRVTGEWAKSLLEEIATITSGGTPSRAESNSWNGHIPWVTTSLIDFNVILNAIEYITEEGLNASSAKLFPKGTVLIAMYGQGKTRGKVALLGIEAATNQACAAILLTKELNEIFVFQNLSSRYNEIRDLSNSGGQENLSLGLISKIPIFYPNLIEQLRIADCLTSLDELITAQTQKIDLLKVHKKGLMQQLFPVPDEAHA